MQISMLPKEPTAAKEGIRNHDSYLQQIEGEETTFRGGPLGREKWMQNEGKRSDCVDTSHSSEERRYEQKKTKQIKEARSR